MYFTARCGAVRCGAMGAFVFLVMVRCGSVRIVVLRWIAVRVYMSDNPTVLCGSLGR